MPPASSLSDMRSSPWFVTRDREPSSEREPALRAADHREPIGVRLVGLEDEPAGPITTHRRVVFLNITLSRFTGMVPDGQEPHFLQWYRWYVTETGVW